MQGNPNKEDNQNYWCQSKSKRTKFLAFCFFGLSVRVVWTHRKSERGPSSPEKKSWWALWFWRSETRRTWVPPRVLWLLECVDCFCLQKLVVVLWSLSFKNIWIGKEETPSLSSLQISPMCYSKWHTWDKSGLLLDWPHCLRTVSWSPIKIKIKINVEEVTNGPRSFDNVLAH